MALLPAALPRSQQPPRVTGHGVISPCHLAREGATLSCPVPALSHGSWDPVTNSGAVTEENRRGETEDSTATVSAAATTLQAPGTGTGTGLHGGKTGAGSRPSPSGVGGGGAGTARSRRNVDSGPCLLCRRLHGPCPSPHSHRVKGGTGTRAARRSGTRRARPHACHMEDVQETEVTQTSGVAGRAAPQVQSSGGVRGKRPKVEGHNRDAMGRGHAP